MSETALEPSGSTTSVFQLFSPTLLPATLMLGGGMTISAVESYITATIAPSIVRDVGGLELFSLVTTLYIAATILGAIFIAMLTILFSRCRLRGLRSISATKWRSIFR